ncbi:hypothetical protein LLH00_05310 [bacterium]|nr:hypothetical protein [bacterium]
MNPRKPPQPSPPAGKLDRLKEALGRKDNPSEKVLRAFNSLMRQEPGQPGPVKPGPAKGK